MGMLKTSHGTRRPPGSFFQMTFLHLPSVFILAWVSEPDFLAGVLQDLWFCWFDFQ